MLIELSLPESFFCGKIFTAQISELRKSDAEGLAFRDRAKICIKSSITVASTDCLSSSI